MVPLPPIADVLCDLLGPPERTSGRREWWRCPLGTHDDCTPSFGAYGDRRWHCFGCRCSGDAVDLLRALDPDLTYRQAVEALGGQLAPLPRRARPLVKGKPQPDWWLDVAVEVVERAADYLWSPAGERIVRHLVERRGLDERAIRGAGLGWNPHDRNAWDRRFDQGRAWIPEGLVIPWIGPDGLAKVNFRLPRDRHPKYAHLKGSDQSLLYPDDKLTIRRPLILVEGELDALLLGRLFPDFQVRTVGSASARLDAIRADTRARMCGCYPWYLATDNDDSGRAFAAAWASARTRRMAPPAGAKDWTDAWAAGVDLGDYWVDAMSRE